MAKKNSSRSSNATQKGAAKEGYFLSDVQEPRRRACQHIEEGAITDSYEADKDLVCKVLNEALATEIVCVLRYKRHFFMATGIHANAVAAEFQEHAADEQEHADQIAERITQIGGEPNFKPEGLAAPRHSQCVRGGWVLESVTVDLV